MANLKKGMDKLDELQEEEFELFGITMTPMAMGAAFALVSTIVGGLYGGFVIYQKIESIAGLDLGEYQQKMDIMDAKVEEALKYAKDIKDGMRSDILRVEAAAERANSKVEAVAVRTEAKVDRLEEKVKRVVDEADARFEARREQLRSSQKSDMKELEDRMNAKVQRALDNPLAK